MTYSWAKALGDNGHKILHCIQNDIHAVMPQPQLFRDDMFPCRSEQSKDTLTIIEYESDIRRNAKLRMTYSWAKALGDNGHKILHCIQNDIHAVMPPPQLFRDDMFPYRSEKSKDTLTIIEYESAIRRNAKFK